MVRESIQHLQLFFCNPIRNYDQCTIRSVADDLLHLVCLFRRISVQIWSCEFAKCCVRRNASILMEFWIFLLLLLLNVLCKIQTLATFSFKTHIKAWMNEAGEPMMIYCFVSICLASVIQTFFLHIANEARNKRVKQILQSSFNPSNMTQVK